MSKRVTLLSASFYILNLCVLLVLKLFLVKYGFFNRLEVTYKLFVNELIIIVSRVRTWWLDSYDVFNGFGIK